MITLPVLVALLFYSAVATLFAAAAASARRRRLYFTQAEYLASLPPDAFLSSDEVEVEKDCVT